MADRPRDPAQDGSAGRDVGDYTSQLPRPVDPWATRAGDPDGDGDAGGPTRVDQPGPGTGAVPPGPGTAGMPPAGPGTGAMPPAGAGTAAIPPTGGDREPAWSGRAGVPVRPAGGDAAEGWPGAAGGGTGGGWDGPERPGQAGRPWWLPILLGVLGLVVIALVGTLIWWVANLDDTQDPGGPGPTTAPTASAPTEPTGQPEPTEAEPTEPEPEQSSAPAEVAVPDLVGLTEAQARQLLDESDLGYRLTFRDSDQPAGTVIETNPPAGSEVPPGTEIELVLAASDSEPSPEPSPSATPTGESDDEDD